MNMNTDHDIVQSNAQLSDALRRAGIPEQDVELWHTGGGVMNVTVVTHRKEGSTAADAYIMFGDGDVFEVCYQTDDDATTGRLNASIYDDRAPGGDGWCEAVVDYIDRADLTFSTVDEIAAFIKSEYDRLVEEMRVIPNEGRPRIEYPVEVVDRFAGGPVPILTVGKLLEILKDVDPACQVTVATDGWYTNVECVDIPNKFAEDDVPCVNIFPTVKAEGGDFDPRQF